jgi:anaerobic selenocysteine-containing dehydrogenase
MRDLTSVQTQVGRYNAANMHPDDIAGLCMSPGSEVIIRSRHGEILAVLAEDPGLRTGVVSMAHGFGDAPSEDGRFREIGSPTNRLVGFDEQVDAHTRMPVQSAVPVAVERLRQGQRPA